MLSVRCGLAAMFYATIIVGRRMAPARAALAAVQPHWHLAGAMWSGWDVSDEAVVHSHALARIRTRRNYGVV